MEFVEIETVAAVVAMVDRVMVQHLIMKMINFIVLTVVRTRTHL